APRRAAARGLRDSRLGNDASLLGPCRDRRSRTVHSDDHVPEEYDDLRGPARLRRLRLRTFGHRQSLQGEMMPTLYHDPRSGNCYKIPLTAAHLGIPFKTVDIVVTTGLTRKPEFLAKNPNGRVPLLELDDGRLLPESNAIIWYLAEGSPLIP